MNIIRPEKHKFRANLTICPISFNALQPAIASKMQPYRYRRKTTVKKPVSVEFYALTGPLGADSLTFQ